LSPGGWLDVIDVQRKMVEHVRREARQAGVPNIRPVLADAGRLPYRDAAFDAAYMIGTLGEIPDGDGALRELHRVLRPAGRLVVGEVFVDPDFVSLGDLKARAHGAGFAFHSKAGNLLAYVARFDRAAEGAVEDGLPKFDTTNLTLSVSPNHLGIVSVAGNARPSIVK
jgi:SAM-dependent methyltransferase